VNVSRSLVVSLLVCLGWGDSALAQPAGDRAPAVAPTQEAAPELHTSPGAVDLETLFRLPAARDAKPKRRYGLGPATPLGRGPSLVEFRTPLGRVRLEFFSLDQLRFKGSLVDVLEDASPASSPSTVFDRSDLLNELTYVVTVPIATF
jgi:hypothetical protein